MKNGTEHWFEIRNAAEVDSPALIVYKDRVLNNIRHLKNKVTNVAVLRPHVKTNKMAEVCRMMMDEGISKFKCATIAEAEMLGSIGARDVLLAYQPVGPKISRLLRLVREFRETRYSCLIDSLHAAEQISGIFHSSSERIDVYVDLNIGMNRTGIKPSDALQLISAIRQLNGISLVGLHAYDGHISDADIELRMQRVDTAFQEVISLSQGITAKHRLEMKIVAGGSPTFSVHSQREDFECSPGTFIFWDWNYRRLMPEEPFEYAALVLTRVVSIVDEQTVCIDLGHKSVAAENPLPRISFLNAPDAVPRSHSEEHMVLTVPDAGRYSPGDILYGVPVHICPTVALYERAVVVENNSAVAEWEVTARDKKIKF